MFFEKFYSSKGYIILVIITGIFIFLNVVQIVKSVYERYGRKLDSAQYNAKKHARKLDKNQVVRQFCDSSQPGEYFVKMIQLRLLYIQKTGNHSNEFPDNDQLVSFNNSLTNESLAAYGELGESYESFLL